jgi:hypothetical protein
MYGVPKNLDLSIFKDASLEQVAIGEFEIQFRFHPEGYVSVEGDWKLFDSAGRVLDHGMENKNRTEYRLHRLLGQRVIGFGLDPPTSFSLRFANDLTLQVFDNSDKYESFSIQPGDIFV